MAGCGWRVAGGGWRVAGGGVRVEGGGVRVPGGGVRVAGGSGGAVKSLPLATAEYTQGSRSCPRTWGSKNKKDVNLMSC